MLNVVSTQLNLVFVKEVLLKPFVIQSGYQEAQEQLGEAVKEKETIQSELDHTKVSTSIQMLHSNVWTVSVLLHLPVRWRLLMYKSISTILNGFYSSSPLDLFARGCIDQPSHADFSSLVLQSSYV